MSKYVPDISSKRWVIISPQRINRPHKRGEKFICPFCPGNEAMTTEEVMRVGKGEPNKPGWEIRVIPNKYPITDFHEVIVHTPYCHKDLEHFSQEHLKKIFQVYRARFNFYRQKGQVIIFCNHRENAGASLKHSHAQLVVLPFQINLDTLAREPMNNIIEQNKHFDLYCPDFSQWPFEVWLAPKKQNTYFGDITDEEIEDMVLIFKKVLKALEKIYDKYEFSTLPFAYNFYIYPKENWYLRLIPRFINCAGFELGTGLSVNIIDPKDAAEEIKSYLTSNTKH
jgi:UDPglucose--hexose-1-phosphate uridylyltransferase